MTGFPDPSWLVGCGNMAGAMVEGWRGAGLQFADVIAIRPSGKPVEGVRTVTELPGGTPRFVMLGFKPQKLDEVAPELARRVGPDTILVSLLAGVEARTLRDRFPNARVIVRAMPNLPVAQRKGVTALYCEDRDEAALSTVIDLIALLGIAPVMADEVHFSAIGSVAGSGPAYVARFVDALAAGGEALGLSPELAATVALETIVGTAAMAEASRMPMAELARRVASPKGTTEAGLAILDAPDGLGTLIGRMLSASSARGRELAETARRG